jgi:integrase
MEAAVASGYISRSPCRGVKLPRADRAEMRFLSASELEQLAEAVPPSYRALVLTTGYTGLRWGEVAGLKQGRLKLLRGTLEVAEVLTEVRGALAFGEPKTKSSRRVLTVPRFLADELQSHLENYSTHPGLVFAGPKGGPLRRNNFRRRVWLPALARAGVEGLRFHDLGHTAAGLLIAQNVHPKVIQSRLGHSSIRVTLDTYGHLLPRLDEEVADGLEATHHAAQIGPIECTYSARPPGLIARSADTSTEIGF